MKTSFPVFAFTKEEDIVLMTNDGYLVVIDPISEVIKVRHDF